MPVSIRRVSPAGPGLWDAVWVECPYATYFHSREWSSVWSAYTGGQIVFSRRKLDGHHRLRE